MVLSISRIGDAGTDMMRADYFADDTEDDREVMGKDQRKTMELTEQRSGIGWKYAGQGIFKFQFHFAFHSLSDSFLS
jgi:hypothetical protein